MSDTSRTNAVGDGLASARAAGDAARQVGEQARQVGADAVGQARDIAQDVQARVGSLASTVGEHATTVAETQKESLAGRLKDVAEAVHRSGEQLEGHQDWVASLVERGADELSALADTMRTNDLQALMGNLQDLARRQPALFVGASLIAGFALARVGKVAVAGTASVDMPSVPEVTREWE